MRWVFIVPAIVIFAGCAHSSRLPSPAPGISSYTIRIEGVGFGSATLEGSFTVDGGTTRRNLDGIRTPFEATIPGKSFDGTFRGANGRRIRVALYDSEEGIRAPAAEGKGTEVEIRWNRAGCGPREVRYR